MKKKFKFLFFIFICFLLIRSIFSITDRGDKTEEIVSLLISRDTSSFAKLFSNEIDLKSSMIEEFYSELDRISGGKLKFRESSDDPVCFTYGNFFGETHKKIIKGKSYEPIYIARDGQNEVTSQILVEYCPGFSSDICDIWIGYRSPEALCIK